jgi:hypothetical protein
MAQRNERLGGEEEGASRALRASAGSRASTQLELERLERYMPMAPSGCAAPAPGQHALPTVFVEPCEEVALGCHSRWGPLPSLQPQGVEAGS